MATGSVATLAMRLQLVWLQLVWLQLVWLQVVWLPISVAGGSVATWLFDYLVVWLPGCVDTWLCGYM